MDKNAIQITLNQHNSEIEHLKDDVRNLKSDKDIKTKEIMGLQSDQARLEDAQKRQEIVMKMVLKGLESVEKALTRMPLLVGFIIFLIFIIDENRHELMAIITAIFGRF